jgi:2-polyprenyl-3-methyl-5-hydroxy-6-metoxy-1,4-benzoquinol methylase
MTSNSEGSQLRLDVTDGTVEITEVGGGRRRVSVTPADPSTFVFMRTWETAYPVDLIERIVAVKGLARVCDVIARDEMPSYVSLFLRYAMLTYRAESAFEHKRLLDFGCGSGSSTVVLARMFPATEIVGVELERELLELAEARARALGAGNVSFHVSPDPASLPQGLGDFDFISLSAVWEHLLPAERRTLVPKLWSVLKPGGVLFVNQLPHRWWIVEAHTTGLPLLNFAPRRVAHWGAKRFSIRLRGDESWDELLRMGIRGGTEREILRVLRGAGGGRPQLLEPHRLGVSDRASLWYAYSNAGRPMAIKRVMRDLFRLVSWVTRSSYAPGLDLAIEKR